MLLGHDRCLKETRKDIVCCDAGEIRIITYIFGNAV